MKNITQSFKVIVLAFFLSFGLSYVYAWTAPTQTPPAGNVEAPVNTSATSQYKSGALGLGGIIHGYSNAYFDGNVGVGTTAPLSRLQVNGPDRVVVNNGYNDGTRDFGVYQWDRGGGSGNPPYNYLQNKTGIGMTAPTQMLDVAGAIHSSGDICTDQAGGKCLSTAGGGGLGYGQTWKLMYSPPANLNVNDTTGCNGSRGLTTTTCTNSTGKPIMVMVKTQVSQCSSCDIKVNGVIAGFAFASAFTDGSFNVIVPTGASYTVGAGQGTVYYWAELR